MNLDIDKIRNSAGMAEVGFIEDGEIVDIISIGDRLIAVKEHSVYELIRADQVDPKRQTISIPNIIQKKVIGKGPNEPIVAKTLLTAKTLFQDGSFEKETIQSIVNLALEALIEFSLLDIEVNNYILLESNEIDKFEKFKKDQTNYIIPSIADIQSRAKTIFQKTDQVSQILIDLIRTFYPKDKKLKVTPYEHLLKIFRDKYGEQDPGTDYLNKNLEFFCHIRSIRNGLDHRLQTVEVKDFEVQENGDIQIPTIELKATECKLNRTNFNEYITKILRVFPYVFENILAMVANDNICPSLMSFSVQEMPTDQRKYQEVRFALYSPLGTGGFFVKN